MNRDRQDDGSASGGSRDALGQTPLGRTDGSGDPNERLGQWERELRDDSGHGLGEDGHPEQPAPQGPTGDVGR